MFLKFLERLLKLFSRSSKKDSPEFKKVKLPVKKYKKTIKVYSGPSDYSGFEYQFSTIKSIVKEYTAPCLHVFKNAEIRNFTWKGSMEGVHVGSRPFSASDMRKKHLVVVGRFYNLSCDDVGEDAFSVQPNAVAKVYNSQFKANYDSRKKTNSKLRGQDKIVQVDGGEFHGDNILFINAVRAVRGKANSTIVLKNCKFVDCNTCVKGDGLDNPRSSNPFYKGKRGPCKIIIENCEAWNCKLFAYAEDGCAIILKNVKMYGGGTLYRKVGDGRVYTK